MHSATTLVLCDLMVWSFGKSTVPHQHPNVTSGDLVDYSDYSEPVKPLSDMPPYLRRDCNQNIVVRFVMHYGEDDKIVDTSNNTLLVTKKKNPEADLSQIWHIHQDDNELKVFFAKVLDLDPADVTVVHMTFSKKESHKKVLIKEHVMDAPAILAKLKAAEGVTT